MFGLNELEYVVIFYCLNNGIQIENIDYDKNVDIVVNAQSKFELIKWNIPITAPDIYYLLEHTTIEELEFAKKKLTDYQIELQMKADPLYPIVKKMIIPLGPSPVELLERIEKLEKQVLELRDKLYTSALKN